MSYCRFENTARDLRECVDHMDEPEYLSPEEQRARIDIIRMAKEIVDEYGDESDQ